MKKGAVIVAAVLIATGIAMVAGAFAASGFDYLTLDFAEYETNTYVMGEDVTRIEFSSGEANLILRPAEDGVCSVVCHEPKSVRHSVYAKDGTLHINAEDRRSSLDLQLFSLKTPTVTVYLPSSAYEALTVEGGTGDVSVPDVFSFSEISVAISTGEITCGAPACDRISLRTGTGYICLSHVAAGSIDLTSSTGRIYVEAVNCAGALSIRTGTGKVELIDVVCKDLHTTGSTGKLMLQDTVASDSFYIERGTGSVRFIRCDAGQITVKTSTGKVTGTLLSGKVFTTKTSTGKVSVPDSTAGGSCTITTSTGNISLSID